MMSLGEQLLGEARSSAFDTASVQNEDDCLQALQDRNPHVPSLRGNTRVQDTHVSVDYGVGTAEYVVYCTENTNADAMSL